MSDPRWDCVALGEVMLRLDPGEGRTRTARTFRVSEGGGEYNVARAASCVFGLRSSVVTALVDNEVGRLAEGLILAGGVSNEHIRWEPFDGLGFTRVGLNFVERGFGLRPGLGVSDRANSAASKLAPGQIDWRALFETDGVRWLHTGGIFAGLSESTEAVAEEAMAAARSAGVLVTYDTNLRPSVWASGERDPVETNRRLIGYADAVFGSVHDFRSALGFRVDQCAAEEWAAEPSRFTALVADVTAVFPTVRIVGMTLRNAHTATRNDWGGLLSVDGAVAAARFRRDIEILDRIGGGDGFVSGAMWALLDGRSPAEAVEIGVAHGALVMTTPGDTSMVTCDEVLRAVSATDARTDR